MATKTASPHNLWLEILFEFIGVSALAGIAGISSDVGDAIVALMVGILIIWFMLHASFFSNLINSAKG
jgi:hypothetical protein